MTVRLGLNKREGGPQKIARSDRDEDGANERDSSGIIRWHDGFKKTTLIIGHRKRTDDRWRYFAELEASSSVITRLMASRVNLILVLELSSTLSSTSESRTSTTDAEDSPGGHAPGRPASCS